MPLFYAQSQELAMIGSLSSCFRWAKASIDRDGNAVVKILKARPQEKYARVIIEVTKDGWIGIRDGRLIALSKLNKVATNGKKEK